MLCASPQRLESPGCRNEPSMLMSAACMANRAALTQHSILLALLSVWSTDLHRATDKHR